MTDVGYLTIMFIGVGVFISGLGAYFDQKIHETIGIGVMLVGILLMLAALLARDLAGYTTPPFQL